MAQVAAAVGVTGARRRLAAAYPGGTIEDEMDRRLRATMDKGGSDDAESASGQILAQIADEVTHPIGTIDTGIWCYRYKWRAFWSLIAKNGTCRAILLFFRHLVCEGLPC